MGQQWNNIVLIDTYATVGTGVLLPCSYKGKRGYSHYAVITNYHVIKEKENIMSQERKIDFDKLHLTIYDSKNYLIPEEDYEIIDSISVFPKFKEDDLGLLLLAIREEYEIDITDYIYKGRLEEGIILWTKGFPGLLQEEETLPIRFGATLQQSFSPNGKLGNYKIDESFHYYEGYHDEDFLGGMSGGPVYAKQDGKYALVGINQGIYANNAGDSPYKLICYISILYILEYFRQKGVILYSLMKSRIDLIWIKEKDNDKNLKKKEDKNLKKKEAICVLGGSGAGKSSFIESLTQNGHILETVGDGQTTRADIYYYLSLYQSKPTIKIKYLNKREFAKKCFDESFADVWAVVLENYFGVDKVDIRMEPHIFLQNNIEYLECLIDELRLWEQCRDMYDNIITVCLNPKGNESREILQKSHVQFTTLLYRCKSKSDSRLSIKKIRQIFNKESRERLIQNLLSLNENRKNEKKIVELQGVDFSGFYRCFTNQNNITTEVIKNPHLLSKEQKMSYVQAILNADLEQDDKDIENGDIVEKILEVLKKQQGIFEWEEISFLISDSQQNAFIDEQKKCLEEEVKKVFFESDKNKKSLGLRSFYYGIYSMVMEHLPERERFSNGISLKYLSRQDTERLKLYVGVKRGKSLASFVKYIEVFDSYYYEYAKSVYESEQNEILLVDTCGLDHIDCGSNNRYLVKNKVEEIKTVLVNKMKQENTVETKDMIYELNNIIYVKKMDAGKPTEISDIFSYIADLNIGGGLYCVFNGVDIFEGSNRDFFAKNKNWHMDESSEGYPKAMRYLLEQRNEEELLRKCKCSTYKKKNLYRVMSKNIITYCGNREIQRKDDKYEINNIVGIKQLFESIFQDEMNMTQIPPNAEMDQEAFEKYLDELIKNEEFLREARQMFVLVFELASVTRWNGYYWQTLRANLRKYQKGGKEKGYKRTENHLWQDLFEAGYRLVFEGKYAEELFKYFGPYCERVYVMVKQMKKEFVSALIVDEVDKECIMHKMYNKYSDEGDTSIINVYNEEIVQSKVKEEETRTVDGLAKVLIRITDFGRLIRECEQQGGKELTDIIDLFINLLKTNNKGWLEKQGDDFFSTRVDIRNEVDHIIWTIKSYGYEDSAIEALLQKRIKFLNGEKKDDKIEINR